MHTLFYLLIRLEIICNTQYEVDATQVDALLHYLWNTDGSLCMFGTEGYFSEYIRVTSS